MLSFPNCKINIGLYVTNRREDGYHDLETIFYPISGLHDALEIIPSDKETQLHVAGRKIHGGADDNLVIKAYNSLKGNFPQIGNVEIHLLKAMPMGAGLGGGSSDGAFMLRLLNDYYKLGLPEQELAEYALQLGSDCPFFIYNSPQFATGRGNIMKPVSLDLSEYSIQLVCPKVHVSTAAAFKMIKPARAKFNLAEISSLPVNEWKNIVSNDFENPVFDLHPELADIKQQLYNGGAFYASMSGSGSSIYGIMPKNHHVDVQSGLDFSVYKID